ncbi:hypothetical protein Q4E40_06775 [Pontibacter sp. BT731]|uniref:hypothetical protein n=1 Tax=Pontibacter coccineus TaxID=3063328 RepID=UPI0026E3B257|nr:hypothetical protein [Pontibacter sp. BT731]MDO6389824.1 hypothetical protein [Pontibacter sp. BT731]
MKKSQTSNRQIFLESFFDALGAHEVLWLFEDARCVASTVVYDPTDPDEQQDFIWHAEEAKAPGEDVRTVLAHLKEYQLLHMDKLKLPVTHLVIPGMDAQSKLKAFDELFNVQVSTVDDGEESGYYRIHE